jgi:dipeptidyl aminopeptidase/acylaminoacyl peptidase
MKKKDAEQSMTRPETTSHTLTPEQVVHAQAQVSFPRSHLKGDFWLNHNPEKNPLTQIFTHHKGQNHCLLPEQYGVRSRVHEYGGLPYTLDDRGLFWIDEQSQQLYQAQWENAPVSSVEQTTLKEKSQLSRIDLNSIQALTNTVKSRYGEPVLHPEKPVILVIEELRLQEKATAKEVVNRLIAINLLTGQQQVIAQGADFYSSPCFNTDGSQLAWIEWNHPDQPWNNTRLMSVAWPSLLEPVVKQESQETERSRIYETEQQLPSAPLQAHRVFPTDSNLKASVQQPSFDQYNHLLFISDHEGYWNLYQQEGSGTPKCLYSIQADCASAPWQFGNSHYQVLEPVHPNVPLEEASKTISTENKEKQIIICLSQNGRWYLHQLQWPADNNQNTALPKVTSLLEQEYSHFAQLSYTYHSDSQKYHLLTLAASEQQALSVIAFDLTNQSTSQVIPVAMGQQVEQAITPEAVSLKLPEHEIHGMFYPNPHQKQAPLLINVHGGPTSCAFSGLQLNIQFWCQQGFSVLDLNHRGSTGYGREYREALYKCWGEADLEDARLLVHWLEKQGRIKADQVVIRGQSAGGYSALRAATLGYFTAAVSLYGISDLQKLAKSTHKFESHYLDWLIGDPKTDAITYQLRSPLYSLSKQTQLPALLLFQGKKDPVVPVDQMSHFAQHYRSLGHHCETFIYQDEAHGFRQYNNRLHQLNTELAFYQSLGILPDAKATSSRSSTCHSSNSHSIMRQHG